jgi:transposase
LSCPGLADLGVLLPHLAGVVIEEVAVTAGLLLVTARAKQAAATCPKCGTSSGRVHSRYSRTLADAAVGGRQVEIRLAVRRFACRAPGCAQRIFSEQVSGLTVRYARKTPPLTGMLSSIAVALAGRAGSRLASALAVPACRQVMLKLVMAMPDPPAPFLRVLGVDDFAIRRGQHYGTLLIDIETGAPLDLIEGRDAKPLADWLANHPGVEVICRDRASAYADGARTGAPGAIQVADRFHLWQNLARAVEKCVAAHRGCLAEPALAPLDDDTAHTADDRPDPTGKFAERTRAKHELVRALRAEGRGLREIARHLGWGLHTVQRFDRAATWQELAESRWPAERPSKLDPFKGYLDQHAGGGHGSVTRLFNEVKALGYDGSYAIVRAYLDRTSPEKAPLHEAPPTVRDVANWLCRRPGDLTEDEKPKLKAILGRCPELQAAYGQVRGFAAMITDLGGENLPQWIAAARDAGLPGIASFAKGLEHDLDAVTNGLTMNWSSGPVEGRVNHIKMVKRQMFGRAGLPLLRKRVLLTAAT